MEKDNLIYGTGCTPSVLDGTEYVVEVNRKLQIPEEFNLQNVMPPVRNQGSSSTCVCQSLTGVLDFIKNAREGVCCKCNGFSIDELYSIRADKKANGMTFKEALSYLRHHGLDGEKIEGYAKVNSIEAAKYALIMFGPIVAGFPVYSRAGDQFWHKIGYNQGGHAVTIVGYNKDGFIIRNSWGANWADRGHVLIPYDEFNQYCFESWTITL